MSEVSSSRVEGGVFGPGFLRALERLRFAARRPLDGQHRAERRSARTGTSLEFAGHRDYSAGDDPRTLDWNAYARLDRLFVKLFHDEEAMQVVVLVDASASMRCEVAGALRTRYDHARLLAAAFAYVALAGQHQVAVAVFDEVLGERVGPLRGRAAFHEVLRFLEREGGVAGRTSLEAGLGEAAGLTRQRSVAVVVSDFLDPAGYERGIQALLHRRFEVVVVRVFDAAESGGDGMEGDLLLVDAETGEELAVDGSEEALARRVGAEEAFREGLVAWCRKNGVGLYEASCGESVESMLVGLQRSGVLRR